MPAKSQIREYWNSGSGFNKISWTPVYKECKDETMRSGNHSQAKKSEAGEWTCETCGGESMDFELFEEFGDINGCLQLGVGKDPSEGNPKTPLEHADVQRARKFIEDMKSAMESAGESAVELGSTLNRVTVKTGDGTEVGHWEDGEEIEEKAADGSVSVVYKSSPVFVTTSRELEPTNPALTINTSFDSLISTKKSSWLAKALRRT